MFISKSYLPALSFLLLFAFLQVRALEPVKITVPTDASAVETFAAEELRDYLGKIYGIPFKVEKNQPEAAIRVGTFQKPIDGLGNDGFAISCDGRQLNIQGGTREGSGVLFGVYEYLENLGCRFLAPRGHEYIPQEKKFVLCQLNIRQKPAFEKFRLVIANSFPLRKKMRQNGLLSRQFRANPRFGISNHLLPYNSHTTFFFIPPAKYSKEHPDFYALRNGIRNFHGKLGELCFSNPEMTAEFIRNVKEYLKKNWRKGMILVITPQDNQKYCECPACTKINQEEGTNGGTLVRFINQVASAVEKDYPDLMIKGNAYQYHRFPPKKTRYHKNVIIDLAMIEGDYAKAFSGAPENEEFLRLLKEWKNRCSNLFLGDYGTTFDNYLLPLPNFDALAERLQTAHKLGVTGVMTINAHGGPGGEFQELRSYLTARLYWNPYADPWKIAEDFCLHYYGKGGRFILDYIKYYHKYLKENNAAFYFCRQPEQFYDRAFLDRAENAFRQAYAAAGSDKVLRERLDLSYTAVQMLRVKQLKKEAPQSQEFQDAINQLENSCSRFKITSISEAPNSMKNFIASMRFKLREIPEFCRGRNYHVAIPSVWTNSNWAKWIQDPASATGRVVQLNTFHNAWAVYFKIHNLPGYNSPIRYDGYVCLRVIPQQRAPAAASAFACGVWVSKTERQTRAVRLKECPTDSYKYIKIAENFPISTDGSAWIAPMKNPKVIKEIRIDHFLFVKREDKQSAANLHPGR